MPTIATQTTEIYKLIESDKIEFMSNMRTITSKYTGETICIFFKGNITSLCSESNNKNTMTSYNSLSYQFMDTYIEQLKSAGDY